MNCVILQPSYIPWRGFFHLIQKADVFVFYDCVQYDDRSWRNRNRIKSPQGLQWLSIPVNAKGAQAKGTSINEVPIVWDTAWNKKHWTTIRHSYSKAPYFNQYASMLEEFYSRQDRLLADFTCDYTIALARALGIRDTRFIRSSSLQAKGTKTERLLSILTQLGAQRYISGPSAKDYIEMDRFNEVGITVEYMTYDYPEYPQLYGAFEPQVSILDLLFMMGPAASEYIWAANSSEAAGRRL